MSDALALEAYPDTFPPDFVAYCRDNGITAHDFEAGARIPRYFYVTPPLAATFEEHGGDRGGLIKALRESLHAEGLADAEATLEHMGVVPWLPHGWYCKGPSHSTEFRVAPWSLHQQGKIVGMDASSVLSVIALAPRPGETVLDLCCAPGMKLGLIADAVTWSRAGQEGSSRGRAVGVDVSMDRLFVARSCLKRRHASGAVLVRADGTVFRPDHVDIGAYRATAPKNWARKLQRASSAADRSEVVVFATEDCSATALPQRFDRVLVDAECTHDGSMAHLVGHAATKLGAAAPRKLHRAEAPLLDASSSEVLHGDQDNGSTAISGGADLLRLQAALLQRGYDLTKEGGYVVYSTCSFATAQNENMVTAFLQKNPSAQLVHPFRSEVEAAFSMAPMVQCSPEQVDQICHISEARDSQGFMMRFAPRKASTSFQFVAKIRRGPDQSCLPVTL